MVRETSIQTYLEIKREGLLSETRQLIYEYVYSKGPKTAREVLRDLNLETNMSGRFTDMRNMGVFKEAGKRKCTVTGRMVIEWDVTQYLPKPLPKTEDESKMSADEVEENNNQILIDFLESFEQRAWDAWKPMQVFRSDGEVEVDDIKRELLDALNDEAKLILKEFQSHKI